MMREANEVISEAAGSDSVRSRDQTPARGRRASQPPRKYHVAHHVARFFLRPLFRVYFGMRAQGLENLPERGSYIIVPSHVSMLDWAFLSYFLTRLTSFVVHREYYDHWLLGVGLRVNGAVPVRSEGADLTAMRSMRALLASGEPLILFPEGGISRDGRPQRAQPGIISLASSTRTPIVPVAFRGAFEAFPRWQRLPRPGRVTVVFGAPLEPPPQLSGRDAQQELADCLMDHIGGLLDGRTSNPIPW